MKANPMESNTTINKAFPSLVKAEKLACADTLSGCCTPTLRELAFDNRNPRLVSELENGLNDTLENTSPNSSDLVNILESNKPTERKLKRISRMSQIPSKSCFHAVTRSPLAVHHGGFDPMPSPSPIDVSLLIAPTEMLDVKVPNAPVRPDSKPQQEPLAAPANAIPAQTSPQRAPLAASPNAIPAQTSPQRAPIVVPSRNDANSNDVTLPYCVSPSPSSHKADTHVFAPGKIIAGKYRVEKKLADGGFGEIYLATQLGLERSVVIKGMRNPHDQSQCKRFLLEANVIKTLVHPNTIQLFDAGMHEDHLFIVMEYIQGYSLGQLLAKEKKFSFQRTVYITRQILKSINEAHHLGIIHRDLKPSNILIRTIIGEQDFVKVLDFGIAKVERRQNEPVLTMLGKVMGTPQYLAPEMFMGEEVQPSVDLFAVGLMMLEMLTGKPPLPQTPSAVAAVFISKDYIQIPQWIRDSGLGAFIAKAVSRNPAQRFQTAAEMLDELTRLEYETTRQFYQNMFMPSRVAMKPKRKPRVYRLMIAAALLLIANAILLFHLW